MNREQQGNIKETTGNSRKQQVTVENSREQIGNKHGYVQTMDHNKQ